jgi:Tfp pilus assembly protein PilE
MNIPRHSHAHNSGFTLVEIFITLTIAMILVGVLGTIITDGWATLYQIRGRVFSDVSDDAYIARRFFDAAIRKSSTNLSVDPAGRWIKAYYYRNNDSTFLDRYVQLFVNNHELDAEYGQVDSKGNESTTLVSTLCANVTGCIFSVAGKSAQMKLDLDDGTYSGVVVTSAVAHN